MGTDNDCTFSGFRTARIHGDRNICNRLPFNLENLPLGSMTVLRQDLNDVVGNSCECAWLLEIMGFVRNYLDMAAKA